MKRKTQTTIVIIVGLVIIAGTYLGSTWAIANAPVEKSPMRQVPCPGGQTATLCFQMSVGPPDWVVALKNFTPYVLVLEVIIIAILAVLMLRRKEN